MREVVISKQVPQEGGGFKIVSKKVSFSNNSVYFDIVRDIQEMERKESILNKSETKKEDSGRKSSRRK